MKASDLQVGDLVSHNGEVIKVSAVHTNKIAYHKTKNKLTWLFSGQFEPIFLTPEILEKNGFYCSEMPSRDETGNFYIKKCEFSNIFVNMTFDDGSDFGNKVLYVHELQHLLKLCGIEKEIIV